MLESIQCEQLYMEHTRVVVVDDHPVVRNGLRSLLSQYADIQVVGEADGGQSALELITELQPDVVLLDIRLVGPSGVDLARQLRRTQSKARVIILTSHDHEAYLLEAAQAGVHGYLLKSSSAEVLADAIRAVHAGERRLSPALVGKALEQLEVLSQAQAQSESGLSTQELQLLKLIADGASTQDMAQALYLSERTVKRKIQDILAKLGAASRAQAVAEAFKRGIL
jgi:DNA-binding NarL/FixJ family response regulator